MDAQEIAEQGYNQGIEEGTQFLLKDLIKKTEEGFGYVTTQELKKMLKDLEGDKK